jgi:hypothetical protein
LPVIVKVEQQFARQRIKYLGADRHAHNRISTFFTRTITALAVQPASGHVQWVIAQMQKRVHRLVRHHPDIATTSTVTSGRSAAGHELLTTKSGHPVSAITAVHANLCSINKHDFQVEISNLKSQIQISDPSLQIRKRLPTTNKPEK